MFSMTLFGRERSETVDSMSSQSSKGFRIKRKFTTICQEAVKSIYFWILVAVCTFAEPMMCAYYPSPFLHFLQFAVLGVSTILFFMQLVGVAANEWAKISAIEALASFKGLSIRRKASNLTWLKLWIFFTAEGEYFFEGVILIYAWVTLPYRPGLAILRCFRVFRLLWFYEVEVFRGFLHLTMGRIIGERFIHRAINVLKFSINAIKALAGEVFSLTEETRGGLMLIMIFFYSAFVLGATMWVEGGGHFTNCHGVGECTFTLIRLTFLDGSGFDFAYNLTEGHYILFFITMGYLVITALGILNGLVGIFGSLITTASIQAFDENQEEAALMYDANNNGDGEGQGLLSDGGEVYNTNLGPNEDESDDSEDEGAYSGNSNASAIMDDPNAAGPDGNGPNISSSSSVDEGEGTTKTSKVTGGALRKSLDMMQERDVSVIDLEAQASGIFPASPVPAASSNSSPVKSIMSRGLSSKAKNMQKYVRMQTDDDDEDDDDDGDVKNFEADANDDLFSIDSTTMQPRVRRNSNGHAYPMPGQLEKIQSGAALLGRNNSSYMQGRLPAHNKSAAGMSMHNILHATGGGSKFVMQQLAKRQREQSMRNLHANNNASSSQAQLAPAAGHSHGNSHGLVNSLPSFFAPKISPTMGQPSALAANTQQRPSLTSVNGNPEAVISLSGSSKEPHVTEQMSPPPSELASPVTEEVRKKSIRNRFQMAAHMAKASAAASAPAAVTTAATANASAPSAAPAGHASAAPHPVNPHHAHLAAAINSGGASTPVGMFPGATPAPKKINNIFGALGGHHHGASHISNASTHSNNSNSLFEVALRQHQQQQQQQQVQQQVQQQLLQQQHGSVSVASALPPALAHFMSDQSQLGEKHTRQLDALQQQMQQMQQTIVSQQDMLQKLMQSLTQVTSLLVQQQQQQQAQPQPVSHHSGSAHHHHSSSSGHHGHSHEAASPAAPSAVSVNVHANVAASSAPNTAGSEISAITASPSHDDAVHPLKTSHKSAKFKVSGATGTAPSASSTGASSASSAAASYTAANRTQGMQLMDMFRPRSAVHHHGSGHHGPAAPSSSSAASTGSSVVTTSGKGTSVLTGGVSPTVPGLNGPPLQAILGLEGAGRSSQPTRNRYGGSAAANGTGTVLDGLQLASSGRDGSHGKAAHHENDVEDLSTLYHQAQHQREVGLGLAPARSFGAAAEKSSQPAAGPSVASHPATGRVVSAAAVTALTDDSSKQTARSQPKNGPSDDVMTADEYELVDVDVLSSKRK